MRFFKPFYIALTLASIFCFCIIAVSLIQPIKSSIKKDYNINFEQLFKSKQISRQNFKRINLTNLDKMDLFMKILNKNDGGYVFNYDKINKNILSIFEKAIKDKIRPKEEIYINLKYYLKNQKELEVDVRWADKKNIQSNTNTPLYFDNILIKLS